MCACRMQQRESWTAEGEEWERFHLLDVPINPGPCTFPALLDSMNMRGGRAGGKEGAPPFPGPKRVSQAHTTSGLPGPAVCSSDG